jgi:hypothetical protein
VREAHLRISHLAVARLATQVPGDLGDVRDACGAERMSLRQQALTLRAGTSASGADITAPRQCSLRSGVDHGTQDWLHSSKAPGSNRWMKLSRKKLEPFAAVQALQMPSMQQLQLPLPGGVATSSPAIHMISHD